MADENALVVEINGDASGLEEAAKKASASLGAISKGLAETAASSTKAGGSLEQFAGKASEHLKKVSASTYIARDAVEDLSHIARDLPYAADRIGLLAGPIGKVATLLNVLKDQTGSVTGAFGALGGALSGGGGLVIGGELLISALALLGPKLFSAGEEAKAAKGKFDSFADAIKAGSDQLSDFNDQIDRLAKLGTLNIELNGLPKSLDKAAQAIDIDEKLQRANDRATELRTTISDLQDRLERPDAFAVKSPGFFEDKENAKPSKSADDVAKEAEAGLKAALDAQKENDKEIGKLQDARLIATRTVNLEQKKEGEKAAKDAEEAARKALEAQRRALAEERRLLEEHLKFVKDIARQKIEVDAPNVSTRKQVEQDAGIDGIYKIDADTKKAFESKLEGLTKDIKPIEIPLAPFPIEGFIKTLQEGNLQSFAEKIGAKIGPGFDQAFRKIFATSIKNAVDAGLNDQQLASFEQRIATIGKVGETAANGISDAFAAIPGSLAAGQSAFAAFGNALKQTFVSILSELIKTIVLTSILKAITGGGGAGVNLAGLTRGAGSSIGTIPFGLAGGGLVTGPTSALVGEGIGTSKSNPELVMPVNQLGKFLQNSGLGGNINVGGEVHIRGNDLVYVLAKSNKSQGRNY